MAGEAGLPDWGSDIDTETFGQIYEMDEEDDHSFSLQIVEDFFTQAAETFTEMDQLLKEGDMAQLSERGHYLKGSSATLGLLKVKDCCEQIQRYGKMENLDGKPFEDKEECVRLLKVAIKHCKKETNNVERILKEFYNLDPPQELEEEEEDEDTKSQKDDQDPTTKKDESESKPLEYSETTKEPKKTDA